MSTGGATEQVAAAAGAAPWWTRAVVYQIYPRSVADSNGDGIGDLRGIIGKLDYLAALGVDVIWLCPIYVSPQDDFGYGISNYQDVDPTSGALGDFDELLVAAHRRGIKPIMDLVVNHTSDEHPWFVEPRSSTTNPKRDWCWWWPAREGMATGAPGVEPTNWEGHFGGSNWELDEATGEYYLHLFSRKQPDLNWENPDVRQAVYTKMRWWRDRGVDGFRMDVINMISKDPALPDGRPKGRGTFGDGTPHYISGPRIHEFLQEMHRDVFSGRLADRLNVGEMPGVTVEEAVLFTDPAGYELDMVFQFEHVSLDRGELRYDHQPLDLRDLKASLGRWQTGLAERAWNSLYWNNHDQPRAVSRFGDDGEFRVQSAKLLGTILHLHRGTPFVYQGDELGMTNVPFISLEAFRDISSVNYATELAALGTPAEQILASLQFFSRDNARVPMQWDRSPHAGFTTGEPWMPVNPNAAETNVEAALTDPDSVLHHYRRLIALRHEHPVGALGDFTILLDQDPKVYAFSRSLGDETLLVLGNFSVEETAVDLPDAAEWATSELLLGNYPAPVVERHIHLRPWESRVYRRG